MEYIKLSARLGMEIIKILQSKNIEPLKNSQGIYSLEFTQEQLDMITELSLNAFTGGLDGIEYFTNLASLKIETYYKDKKEYIKFKNRASITDKDLIKISKLSNLKQLSIIGQTNIGYIDLSNLSNLTSLEIKGNSNLTKIDGLEKLEKIEDITIFDNNELYEIPSLNTLTNNNDLYEANIDLFYFKDFMYKNGKFDEKLKEKLELSNVNFLERVGLNKVCKTNFNTAIYFDNKCNDIVEEIKTNCANNIDYIVGVEKYLAENVKYDYAALNSEKRLTGEQMVLNDKIITMTSGSINGTNGAVNGVLYNKCVCEGYTRTMQYLLKKAGIKSKNIYCIAAEDNIGMASDNIENKYYDLPRGERHSIIRVEVEDNGIYYCDPCWDAIYYQKGFDHFPYLLLTKKEISKDHMLSFDEKNIIYDISIPRSEIKSILDRQDAVEKNR